MVGRQTFRNNSWQVVFGSLLLFTTSCPLWAQGVSTGVFGTRLTGFGDVDVEKTVDFWAENERSNIEQILNLHIDLMESVCSLSQEQAQKLRLAVKGVVARHMAEGRTQFQQLLLDVQLIQEEQLNGSVPKPKEYANKLRVFGASKLEEGVVFLRTEFEFAPTQDELWTKVLASALSDEQLEELEAYYVARNSNFLKSAIERELLDLSQQVFLNEEQQGKLQEHFYSMFEDEITPQFPISILQASKLIRPSVNSLDELKVHLRPIQITRLETLKNSPRASVGWGRGPSR